MPTALGNYVRNFRGGSPFRRGLQCWLAFGHDWFIHEHLLYVCDIWKTRFLKIKRKTESGLCLEWLAPAILPPRTWKRMAPSSCNAASAPVYETTFTLGQYSHVHPARLEWYIVGARWLAGGSTVQSLNRQRTHGSSVQLTAASFAYSPRAVTRWQSKKKKENNRKARKENRLILHSWKITCSPTRMIYSQLADVRIWLH